MQFPNRPWLFSQKTPNTQRHSLTEAETILQTSSTVQIATCNLLATQLRANQAVRDNVLGCCFFLLNLAHRPCKPHISLNSNNNN